MEVENQLKQLILENFKSVREFTLKIGVPYSTVNTIFTRGIDGTNIRTIVNICKALNIDVESLSEGKIIKKINTRPFSEQMSINDNIFMIRIKKLMDESNLSITDICEDTDLSIDDLKEIINGLRSPTPHEIRTLSQYFQVLISYLSGASGYRTREEQIASLNEIGTLKGLLEGVDQEIAPLLINCFSVISDAFQSYKNSQKNLRPILDAAILSLENLNSLLVYLYSYDSLPAVGEPSTEDLFEARSTDSWCRLMIYKRSDEIKSNFLQAVDNIVKAEYTEL